MSTPSRERVIGVDLGGTKIAAALIDRAGAVDASAEHPTPTSSQVEVLAALEAAIVELMDGNVAALGFGLPSRIDQRTGRAEGSVNIPLQDVALHDLMADRFDVPVGIENDASAAALAEWTLGAGRGTEDMVMLTLGTGVGGGVVTGGRLFRGWAEFGHIVIEYDGPRCQGACTGRGHLEALVSGHAADSVARELLGPAADAHELVAHAHAGDTRARDALASIGRSLGAGIGSLINIFRPEIVVVGGGFAAAGELLFAPAREIIRREALAPLGENVQVVPAQLGTAAGPVGAGLIGFEALDTAG